MTEDADSIDSARSRPGDALDPVSRLREVVLGDPGVQPLDSVAKPRFEYSREFRFTRVVPSGSLLVGTLPAESLEGVESRTFGLGVLIGHQLVAVR